MFDILNYFWFDEFPLKRPWESIWIVELKVVEEKTREKF